MTGREKQGFPASYTSRLFFYVIRGNPSFKNGPLFWKDCNLSSVPPWLTVILSWNANIVLRRATYERRRDPRGVHFIQGRFKWQPPNKTLCSRGRMSGPSFCGARNKARSWADVKRVRFRERKRRRLESGWNKDAQWFKRFQAPPSNLARPHSGASACSCFFHSAFKELVREGEGVWNPPTRAPPHPAKHPTLFPADFFLVREEKRVAKELRKDWLWGSFSISLKFRHTLRRGEQDWAVYLMNVRMGQWNRQNVVYSSRLFSKATINRALPFYPELKLAHQVWRQKRFLVSPGLPQMLSPDIVNILNSRKPKCSTPRKREFYLLAISASNWKLEMVVFVIDSLCQVLSFWLQLS